VLCDVTVDVLSACAFLPDETLLGC